MLFLSSNIPSKTKRSLFLLVLLQVTLFHLPALSLNCQQQNNNTNNNTTDTTTTNNNNNNNNNKTTTIQNNTNTNKQQDTVTTTNYKQHNKYQQQQQQPHFRLLLRPEYILAILLAYETSRHQIVDVNNVFGNVGIALLLEMDKVVVVVYLALLLKFTTYLTL